MCDWIWRGSRNGVGSALIFEFHSVKSIELYSQILQFVSDSTPEISNGTGAAKKLVLKRKKSLSENMNNKII